MELFQPLGYRRPGYAAELPDLLYGQASAISELDTLPALVIQTVDSVPQTFQLEVPERRILHRTPDTDQTGQHRFKLTFTQVPFVPLFPRLFPLPILLQEVRDLPWH